MIKSKFEFGFDYFVHCALISIYPMLFTVYPFFIGQLYVDYNTTVGYASLLVLTSTGPIFVSPYACVYYNWTVTIV